MPAAAAQNKSHDKVEHQEIVHIRVERQLIVDRAAQLICEEEAHRDGKHEEIAHRNTKIKHHRAKRERDSRSAHLLLVKCRPDKRPQQIKQHGKRKNNGKPQRQIDVCEKLSRQIIVDDFNVEIAGRKRLKSGNAARNVGKQTIKGKIAVARRHYDIVEKPRHKIEEAGHKNGKHSSHLEQHLTQVVKMSPKLLSVSAIGEPVISSYRYYCRLACRFLPSLRSFHP